MAKKEFNIQDLINLQKTVESLIGDYTYKIIASNAKLKSAKEYTEDTPALYTKLNALYDQLNIIKLAKDKSNRSKTSLGKTNQQLIYELSNLNRKKTMLEVLFGQKLKTRKGGKVNEYEFNITKNDINEYLDETTRRISDIKKAMTDFNNSHKVKIVIDDSLDLA